MGPEDAAPVGPADATTTPRFTGSATFARLPALSEVQSFDIAILGIPFDGGTSYRPGARFGPMAVRQASRHLRPEYHPDLDVSPFRALQVVDAGDVPCTPFSIDEAIRQIEEQASQLVSDRTLLLSLGGDHTITLPLLRAVRRIHGPVALVHFDAHLDTWNSYFGADRTHGTVLRRAFEEGLLLDSHSTHVGTRGPLYGQSDLHDDAGFGFRVIRCGDIDLIGVGAIIERISKRAANMPVYVSIDIDVLDPAYAPGTGTPEMGGFSSRELLRMLRGLDGGAIVGADVVEVSPTYDHAEITALAAATVTYDMCAVIAKSRVGDIGSTTGVPRVAPVQ